MKADKKQTPSSEDQRRAGHREILGETYAKFEFFENGWNPYTRFLDVDKVDIILRKRHQNRPIYREIQVKYGKLWPLKSGGWEGIFDYSSWRFYHEDEFKAYLNNPDFYVVLILAADSGYNRDVFIFPVRDFDRLVKSAFLSGGKRKVIICRSRCDETKWYIRRVPKILEITPDSTVDISKFRRNFSLLNPI